MKPNQKKITTREETNAFTRPRYRSEEAVIERTNLRLKELKKTTGNRRSKRAKTKQNDGKRTATKVQRYKTTKL